MRIRTQFVMTVLLFGVMLAGMSASAIITNARVDTARDQSNIARKVAQGASELSYLASDYVIFRENQQLERWQTRFNSFLADVLDLKSEEPEQRELIDNINVNTLRLRDVFDSVVSAVGDTSGSQGEAVDLTMLQISWSRMAIQGQALTSDATRLADLLSARVEALQFTNTYVLVGLIAIFLAYFALNYFMTQRRALKGIAELQDGAAIIGSGNLDYHIEERKNDEIGDLSRSFNRMAADLKAVTASKKDLETEIVRRVELEDELRISEEELRTSNEILRKGATELEDEIEERKKVEQALRESEQRWATTLSSIGDAVISTDTESKITFMNAVAEDLTGWRLDEALGRPVSDVVRIINEHTRQAAENPVSRVIKEGLILGLANHTVLIRKDGSEVPIDDSGAPIRDDSGKVTGVVLVFRDVTERRRTEEMKDEFIGMVSHEVKTPLTVIIGALSMATDSGLSEEESRELIADAVIHADVLAGIVDNLLEMSRSQSNRLVLVKEPTSIEEVARAITEKLKNKSSLHRLVVDMPPGLARVDVDRARTERVLYNLVDNAIKYSPRGGEVRIFTRLGKGELVVGVSDEGMGISKEDQPRLFRKFERFGELDGSIQGIGLGLNVCRILVEAHGGRIWVESEPGAGSTFFFTIPLTS